MELVTKDTLKEYEAFNKSHPKGHFCQSVIWSKVKTEWKWEVVLVRDENKKIKGSIALLIRKLPYLPYSIMYSPRGPVCDPHDVRTLTALIQGAKELAKKYKSYTFKIDPDIKSEDREFVTIMKTLGFGLDESSKNFDGIQPRYVFRLNIEGKTEEEVMASFHEKWRYNIRLASRKGVEVKIAPREELEAFTAIMKDTGKRDGFITRNLDYFQRMYDEMGEHLRLYMAYFEGKPIAGTLAIAYGDKVWYLYGASANEYRNVMPNYLLQWSMIKWAVELHAKIYDFRGVSGDLSEDNPLYGLYRFKKGFNGEFTEFCGEFEMILNKKIYFAAEKGKVLYYKVRKKFLK